MVRQFDSVLTRVRPFFQPLLQRDPSGLSWLGVLLQMGEANPYFSQKLAAECGPLLDQTVRLRQRPDRALRNFGISRVPLEDCFERRLPPPQAFLRWLIQNPQRMVWPKDAVSPNAAQQRRRQLFGFHGMDSAQEAQRQAIAELDRVGAAGSNGKWWAFEGFTQVDCLLETANLLLLVEGKRTEPLSAATRWFPQRNQVLRNLEVAEAAAGQKGKQYAVVLMAEDYLSALSLQAMEQSLPHLPPRRRAELAGHYLGCITWSQATLRLFFPHTIEEAAQRLRRQTAALAAGA
jgi:hypothetical protein